MNLKIIITVFLLIALLVGLFYFSKVLENTQKEIDNIDEYDN